MSLTVQKCADEVQKPEMEKKFGTKLKFFALQFYGECWAGGESASKTYFLSGTSKNCYSGTGGSRTNFVYHFGALEGMPNFVDSFYVLFVVNYPYNLHVSKNI